MTFSAPRRLLTVLTAWCMLALFASAAQAQIARPSDSVYLMLRGSLATYTGDLDSDPDNSALDLTDGFDDPGFGVGGELGYLLNENLSFGLGFLYQDLPALNNDGDATTNVQGGEAYQFQGLFRYLPFARSRVTPFLELGAALVSGQGTENERDDDGDADEDVWGYGPVVGLGLDVALTPRLGVFLGAQSTMVFPDVALDGADPGAFGLTDGSDFDVLTHLGGGLRFAFRSPVGAPEIAGLECPSDLSIDQTGSFLAVTDADASTTWAWGDGTSGSGRTAVHRFSAPGTYTVTATTRNQGGSDTDSCLVSVGAGAAPTLASCRATMASAGVGEEVTFQASATDADAITVDFGDGSVASDLPARHAFRQSGTYRVTITAANAYGQDTCAISVTVGDAYCQGVSELSAVNFGYGASSLTYDATSRLDETIEILRRCPDICVTINGYSDGSEPGDAVRVSQARANAVREYYVAQGIESSRLRAIGRGVDPTANPKEDPGPGDRLGRRVDSIPGSCAGF